MPTALPPLDPLKELGIPRARVPRHVAIIMDGNGRWAKQRGLPRIQGHEQGAKTVRTIVTHAARLKLEALTLFSFSTENWKRPRDEVEFLMELYVQYLIAERATIMENNVRFVHLGRREGLPVPVLREMDETVSRSAKNTGTKLCLALNYGARDEIIDAIKKIARDVKDGRIEPKAIDANLVSQSLYTAGLPDPDLLIRTANERRISNFLLWQISYAELYITDRYWPDFGVDDFNAALIDFSQRERRFGAVTCETPSS